jgi:hypothetical protein
LHGVAKTEKPIAAKKENHRHRRKVDAKSTIAAKTETPQSSQLDDKSDPVIKKAKATLAVKMEIPASVEFVEMKGRQENGSASLSTPFAATSGENASGGETETGRFYISSKKTRRTSASTF